MRTKLRLFALALLASSSVTGVACSSADSANGPQAAAPAEVTPVSAPVDKVPEAEPAASPEASTPDAPAEVAKPEAATPEATKPEETKPEAAKPRGANLEAAKPAEEPKPEAAKPEESKPEAAKPAETKPEEAKPDKPAEPVSQQVSEKPAEPAKKPAEPDQLAQGPAADVTAKVEVGPADWSQWGGSPHRNNTPDVKKNPPMQWDIGDFDRESGEWVKGSGENVNWVSRLGSQTYGNPVIANGQIYVGTNNGAGWIERYPANVDLGCLLCFKEDTGEFLWQHSSEKLPTGRVHDWPLQGICYAPMVQGKRLWFVTSRGEVRCLDTEGFHDGENDGPYKDEASDDKKEADVIWVYDMMSDLGTSQHNMCSCSVTAVGDKLFVNTSNGVDESHLNLPSPNAASFICLDKNTGELLWKDGSPGINILHGQWSSPTYAVLGGQEQVIFPGGDGWVYSFDPDGNKLWEFDCNPKDSKWILGGRGTRNNVIGTAVIYNDLVYVGVGQDPEHGEGVGHLWCIDPTKRGDVSPTQVVNVNTNKPVEKRRIQAYDPENPEEAIRDNPNSAAIWHYSTYDQNGDGDIDFEETMHRTCGTVAIKDDLLFIADFSGLFHCLDAKTGKPHWTYDMLAAAWGSALIAGDKVYIGDEDGDVAIFQLSGDPDVAMPDGGPLEEINMGNSVYSTPVMANGTLFISNKTHLFSIGGPNGGK